ncbi:hypothetical protein SAMN05216370_3044 [Pseudomonas peli]|jgi:hypothetical protein|uniref:Uncharacterized protein n=1 Tax=Pseudomonas peli TaxID=592361 RepID=A0AB37ZAL6_9PSED|nr:MAG: hypothetical protein CUR33_16125 [Pseudomonas sp.] [Pseudomonas sp. FEMGT703P]SCW71198.1 hypothetical protein SAMN05216370_3044 [Pseudomonas peli]
MNTADGLSDEELDTWADIFYQAKIGGVTEVTFSQFLSCPFMHLSSAFHKVDRPENGKSHLRLAYSNAPSPKISQAPSMAKPLQCGLPPIR